MYAADRFQRVHDFLDFCKSKHPCQTYHWADARICACGQFFGVADNWYPQEKEIADKTGISLNSVSGDGRWTFGALAKRIERELAKA